MPSITELVIIVLLIAAIVIGAIVLHVGTAMTWGTILDAIDTRFPQEGGVSGYG